MKRMGDPQEIANALVFLSSPAASFIAGSVMDVNGGVLMR
jgi:3-oxoacyl-[acyl-carrier protein] reductase